MRKILTTALAVFCTMGLSGLAQALPADFYDKLNADSRPEADKVRDAARRPGQVLTALQVDAGMTVVDVAAGGGWYTRVISAAVGPQGKVVAQFGARALQNNDGKMQKDMAAELGNVEAFFGNMDELPAGSADRAITALSIHHQTGARGQAFLKGIYDALKPGGMAAIIDHEGSAGMDNAGMHRITAAEVRAMIQESDFEIVEESDLLHTNADDHTLNIRDPALARNTDRFLFIVRK